MTEAGQVPGRGVEKCRMLGPVARGTHDIIEKLLAAAVNSTVVADENLTVGSAVWLPAESIAPGR